MGALPLGMIVRILSDRKLQPAALQLVPGDNVVRIDQFCAQPLLVEIAQRFVCVLEEGDAARLSPAQLQSIQSIGCEIVPAGVILPTEAFPDAALPKAVRYLAGDWYFHPLLKPSADRAASRTLALKLVQLVACDADTREIEEIFRREPTLSYHLLRLVNSPGVGAGRVVTSFAQAILILGRSQLRRWLNLLLFASRKDDPRAPMLMARAAVRGRLLEMMARESGLDGAGRERAFMVGMFSLLGCMFGMSLAELLPPLKLDDSITAALLRREGEIGQMLAALEAAEAGDSPTLEALLSSGCDFDQLALEANLWMLDLILTGPADV